MREVNVVAGTGLEVPIRDPRALADAMRLLANDPDLREKFGRAGRTRVKERFTVGRMTEAHLDLYARVRGP